MSTATTECSRNTVSGKLHTASFSPTHPVACLINVQAAAGGSRQQLTACCAPAARLTCCEWVAERAHQLACEAATKLGHQCSGEVGPHRVHNVGSEVRSKVTHQASCKHTTRGNKKQHDTKEHSVRASWIDADTWHQ